MAEQRELTYFDDLDPSTTMRDVFADLYAKGDAVAKDIATAMKIEREQSKDILGRVVRVDAGWSNEDDEPFRAYRIVTTDALGFFRSLVYLGDIQPREDVIEVDELDQQQTPDQKTEEEEFTTPMEIAGFMPVDFALLPNYRIISNNGQIESSIWLPDLEAEDEDVTVDYIAEMALIGTSKSHENKLVSTLEGDDKKRLHVVANAISLGIARAEMLRDGADINEVWV